MQPPRALWVPFVLGRPFGVPGDAAFQGRVVRAALMLLEAPAGPVLKDFPEEAPASGADAEPFACPVSFPDKPADGDAAAMQREIAELSTWHELTKSRRGRTTFGVSGLTPSAAVRWLSDFMADPKVAIYRDGLERVPALRL